MMNIDRRSYYTKAHMMKAMLLLYSAPLGRSKLMKELELNEASARTLLKKLEKNRLVRSSSMGHILTKKGARITSQFKNKIMGPYFLKKSNITISRYNVAYVVKNRAGKIKKGLEQRDNAIRAGADGLTTLVRRERFMISGIEHWIIPKYIEDLFKNISKNNDVILIGSAKNKITADLAGLSSAMDLLKN